MAQGQRAAGSPRRERSGKARRAPSGAQLPVSAGWRFPLVHMPFALFSALRSAQ
jgi:hypothetical protein